MILDSISQFFCSRSPAGIAGAASCVVIGVAGVTAILVKHFRQTNPERPFSGSVPRP